MQDGGGGLGQLAGGGVQLGDVPNDGGELHGRHVSEASTASSGLIPRQKEEVSECGGVAEHGERGRSERSKSSSVAAWPSSSTFGSGGRVRARPWQRHDDGAAAPGKVQRRV